MSQAKVKFWKDDSAYGFAVLDDGEGHFTDIFIHANNFADSSNTYLEKDDMIECEVVSTPKGLAGMNVRLIK